MPIVEEEFLRWKEDDVTKKLLSKLHTKREQIKEELIRQLYDNPEYACGKAQAFLDVIEMKYEDLMETDKN